MKLQRKEMVSDHPFGKLPSPDGKSEPEARFELAYENEDGDVCIPILDDSQLAFVNKRKQNEKEGVRYYDPAAATVAVKGFSGALNELTELKDQWRDSILSFKHKDSVFQRYDGKFFERSFEPVVSGRIYEYPRMIEGKPHLVFQTDRGWWFVPCKSPKHLKRMVSPLKRGENGVCPNFLRKYRQALKTLGGAFYDEITGLPLGSLVNTKDNSYELPWQPGVKHEFADEYHFGFIDFEDPIWSEPTPWEVSCA